MVMGNSGNFTVVYTDISFTLNNRDYFSLLKVLMFNEKLSRKILFGSDYYMVETETDERRFGIDLRAYLGNDYFNMIALDAQKICFVCVPKNGTHTLYGHLKNFGGRRVGRYHEFNGKLIPRYRLGLKRYKTIMIWRDPVQLNE